MSLNIRGEGSLTWIVSQQRVSQRGIQTSLQKPLVQLFLKGILYQLETYRVCDFPVGVRTINICHIPLINKHTFTTHFKPLCGPLLCQMVLIILTIYITVKPI